MRVSRSETSPPLPSFAGLLFAGRIDGKTETNGKDRYGFVCADNDHSLQAALALCFRWRSDQGPLCADTVAKVVLQKVSKIPRAAGAVFV